MNGLRNNLINTKTRILLGLITLCFFACNPIIKKQKLSPVGYLNSETYKELIAHYENKEIIKYSDKRFFNLISEEGFLFAERYNFYAIYLYQTSSESELYVYVLKFTNDIGIASFKEIEKTRGLFYKSQKSTPEYPFKIKMLSRIIDNAEIKRFKKLIPLKEIQERPPENIYSPFRFLFYYDGNNYYRLSNQQVDEKTLNEIDNLFRKSSIFKE